MKSENLQEFEALYTKAVEIAQALDYNPAQEPIGSYLDVEQPPQQARNLRFDLIADFNLELYASLDGPQPIDFYYPPYYCKKVADQVFQVVWWTAEKNAWLLIKKRLDNTVYRQEIETLEEELALSRNWSQINIKQLEEWEKTVEYLDVQNFWNKVEALIEQELGN